MSIDKKIIIEGAKGGKGGGGGRAPVEADNTLSSSAVVRIAEILSEGEILGFSTGDNKSVFFDDTPILNGDGTVNFENAKADIRFGLPSQPYMEGFSAVETEKVVGVAVTAASSVTRTVSAANVSAARVTIQFPQGMTEQSSTTGDLNGSKVDLAIDVKLTSSGTWTTALNATVQGKTISVYEKAWRIERPTGTGTWDIRVRRITADATSAAIHNATTWARFTEIVDIQEEYNYTAYVGIQTDAESTGGSVPVRSYQIKGIKCKVPSNYNPTAHTYSGQWNGTFVTAWTDNPAWVLYDLLTNSRYGMGEFIDESMIDKWSFYDAGVYNDFPVKDGKGSLEPRFTFNGVIQARDDAIKVLQAVASCMRASIAYYGGLIRVNQDRKGTSVQMVKKEDVIDGKFTYQSSALTQRNTAAFVTFNDKSDKWMPKIVEVENKNGVDVYGFNPVEIAAFGCTSEGQARRLAMWSIYTNLNQRESCTWKASFNQQTLVLGDIVTIHDDDYGVERDFRIMSIKLDEPNIVSIEAVLYDNAKYDYCDDVDAIAPPVFNPPGTTLTAVTNITWTPVEVNLSGSITYNLQLEWKPPTSGNPTRYEVKWRKDNGNFETLNPTTPSITIENVTPGTFEARIIAFSASGVFSPTAQSTYVYTIAGTGTTPPPTPGTSAIGTPTNLQIVGGGQSWNSEDMNFEWKAPNPIGTGTFTGSLKDFEVKIYNANTSALLRTVYVAAVAAGAKQTYSYTLSMNLADGGPLRSLKVEVRCRDAKNLTGPAVIATFVNPAPSALGGLTINATVGGFIVTYNLPTDADFAGIYIWASSTPLNAGNLSSTNLVYDGTDNQTLWKPSGGVAPLTTYYFAAAGYDKFSKPVNGSGLNPVFGNSQSSPEISVTASGTAPTTGNFEGRIWYNTVTGKLMRYTNGQWVPVVPDVTAITGLTSAQIASLEAAKLTGQITTTQISDNAISTPKLMAGSILSANIAADQILTSHLRALAVTTEKIAANAITAVNILAGSILSDKIAANSILAGQLQAGIIGVDKLAANTGYFDICSSNKFYVDEAHIRDLNVSTLKIKDQAVTIPITASDYGSRNIYTSGYTATLGVNFTNDSAGYMNVVVSAVYSFNGSHAAVFAPDTPTVNAVTSQIKVDGNIVGNNRYQGYIDAVDWNSFPIISLIVVPPGTHYITLGLQAYKNDNCITFAPPVCYQTDVTLLGVKK